MLLFYSDYLKKDIESIRAIQKENLEKNQTLSKKIRSIFSAPKPKQKRWEREYYDMQSEHGLDHRGVFAFFLEQYWRMNEPVTVKLSPQSKLSGLSSKIKPDTLPEQFLIEMTKGLGIEGYWLPSILVSISVDEKDCLYRKSIASTLGWLGINELFDVERDKGLSVTLSYQSPPSEISSWVVSTLNQKQISIYSLSENAKDYNARCKQVGQAGLDDSGDEEEYVNQFIFRANQTALAVIHQLSLEQSAGGGFKKPKNGLRYMAGREIVIKEYRI